MPDSDRDHSIPHDLVSQRSQLWATFVRRGLSGRLWAVGLAAILFLGLAEDVWNQEVFSWDASIMLAIHHYSQPWLDRWMLYATQMGLAGAIGVAIVVAAWWWRQGKLLEAGTLAASLLISAAVNILLKWLFGRVRPTVFSPISSESSYSFPSGHTMTAMALYGFLAVLLWRQGRRAWAAVCLGTLLLVAFSRVYLGVHYPSDVLGALAVGGILLSLVVATYDRYKPA